ncbi:MAG TPA: SDR family NAD(P)-dependent oxidoreductase [Pseudomonadales bacterium]|nr:SDR family NAD(P)-dependent oxidoreductase [Pseudomonadales bacterium]
MRAKTMVYSEEQVPSQQGKVVFITGANTGIGYETARIFAGKDARVLLGCRSESKAQLAISRIRDIHPQADLTWLPLDLADLNSIRAAASVAEESQLDILINNAAVMAVPRSLTRDGFEHQFGVNHLGHFALTGLLIKNLIASPGARIVTVSSLAHRSGKIDFDDITGAQSYSAMSRYQMSKAANLYFTLELHRRLLTANKSALSVGCHPGIATTEIGRHFPAWLQLITPLANPFFNSAAQGALPCLFAATSPTVKGMDYYGPTKRGESVRSAGQAIIASQIMDETIARRLWDLSAELTGIAFEV